MNITDKYSNTTENDTKKIVISNESYAIVEAIDALIKKIEQARNTIR